MKKALEWLTTQFSGLNVGRADPKMLQSLKSEEGKPLSKYGQINMRDRNTLSISLFDPSDASHVTNTIRDSELGLNPQVDGSIIFVSIPKPTQEFKDSLIKKAIEFRESAKGNLRKIRKEALDDLKKLNFPIDDDRRMQNEIQKLTELWTKKADDMFKDKEKEVKSSSG